MHNDHKQFVHLHCHSEYSLLDGLSRVKDLVQRAAELGQPAIALTDHGAMYGTMPFYRAARAAGIKPIIGIETYLAKRTMVDKDPQLDKTRFHMLLLAENQPGYLNLLQIASAAQLDGYYYKPRIDRAFMASHKEGLIATTGCMAAEIPRAIGDGRVDAAKKLMGTYLDIFGKDRLFIELQEHSIPELTTINRQLIELAPHFGLENNFLATNDVHYTLASDADPHEVLLCIQTGSTVQNPKLTFSDKGYYVKSFDEMYALFQGQGYPPEVILNALKNSLRIVEMCDVRLDSNGYHLPVFEVPAGQTPATYLRQLCEEGLAWRYGPERAQTDDALRARLEHELTIIGRMGFETYFLIVWDLCEWAVRSDRWWQQHQDPFPYESYSEWKENDIWWNVRGSGAGSVVAYTLGITSIDPLANGLIFERFLNPGRISMPDIDLDYPDDARHWMVAYAKRRYGAEKVAQIITFGTLGARAAIRDVGRALDMPLPEVDGIARLVPAIPGKPVKISNVLDKEHEFYAAELEQRYKAEKAVRELLDTAANLEGVARHASSHAAGVIISDRPLHEYVPLNKPTSGDEGLGGVDRVTQWPMEIVESIGLLKVDFLGLSTLTVMRRAARLIEERYGTVYTMDNIPYDVGQVGPDPTRKPEALFDMLERGEVAGVFQVEGAGMRRLMIEMKPRRFDHIIAAISLYRPGPMENIPEYIRRMHAAIFENKDIVAYHTPALESILGDTYGILVYQEQIIRIASELAGYEPGEADMIRKAVSKKKKDLMEKHRLQFTEGAMAKGFSREVCEAIWGDIEFFARYGFNKCLPGDTEVIDAATGRLVKLEDLANGRVHLSTTISCDTQQLKLQTGQVTAVLDNGIKPVYRLTTSLGKQIEATANHPFFTFDGWRWLGELTVGEQIALPRSLPVAGQTPWPEHEVIRLGHLLAEGNEKASEKLFPEEVFMLPNAQIRLLLGRLWDGDGSIIIQPQGNAHAYYATASERLARQLQHLLLRLGIMSSFRIQQFNYKDGRIGYQVHIMGGEHMLRFAELIGPHLLRPDHLAICESLIAQGRRATAVNDTTPLPVKELVRREEAASDMSWVKLNAQTGIAQRELYPTSNPTKKGFRRQTIGRLAAYFDSEDLRRCAESDLYWDEIVAIEYVGQKQTYDLTIAGTHNFIANDILVHNSHAADYAKVTCQTAFLKAHYPVEYLTAMLSVERDNTDKVRRYFAEAKSLGIDVAPPDVNRSALDFTIEDDGARPLIRFGLGAIKNAGAAALSMIIEEREANGPFAGVQDLCERVDLKRVGKRPLEYMIKGRAFDAWGSPAQFMEALERIVSYSGTEHAAAATGQMSLFGGSSSAPALKVAVDLLHPPDQVEKVAHKTLLEWEKEALGVHVSEHPLERPLARIQSLTNASIGELDANWHTRPVRLAGMISTLRTLTTKKGEPMAFATLEDLEGRVDLVFFPRTWKEVRDQVQVDQVMLVFGKVQFKGDDPSVLVDRVDTNPQVASSADETLARRAPAATPQNGNGYGRDNTPPADWAAAPVLAAPPPPPNFEEGSEAQPIAVAKAPAQPPRSPLPSSPPQTGHGREAAPPTEAAAGPALANTYERTYTVVIEVKPAGNWQKACRDALRLANEYEGKDGLSIRIAGKKLQMDFPNGRTKSCPELFEALRLIPGIHRVFNA